MDPFSASSKAFPYQESGLDSERRFRKSLSAASTHLNGGVGGGGPGSSLGASAGQPEPQLAPFDYPSPSVSRASSATSADESSPPASPAVDRFAAAAAAPRRRSRPPALDPPFELGQALFPPDAFAPPPSDSTGFGPAPPPPPPKPPVKQRKDVYNLESMPSPYLRTMSRPSAALPPKQVNPRAAEEGKWQAAMARGFDQVASGKVTVDLDDNRLTFIPVTVTDMANYVAVPSPFKEYKGLSHGRNYASPHRSPATSPRLAPATRTFSRVASAPASTTAAQANLAALQGRRIVSPSTAPTEPSTLISSASSVASSSTATVRFSAETPPSSPMSSTASTTPRAPPPVHRLLPGRPPSPASSSSPLAGPRGVARAVTFAPATPVSPASSSGGGGGRAHKPPSLAQLSLLLSNNQISRLPSQLFELKNLTFLTLRNNKLTALPAAISALTNLEELNIGLNRITFLPSTILDMTSLKRLTLHPNPFLTRPAPSPTTTTTTTATTLPPASSPGALAPSPPPLPPMPSAVPSLYELCLRVLLSQQPDPTGKASHQPPPFLTAYADMLTIGAFASAAHLRSYATAEDDAERVYFASLGWAAHTAANIHEVDAARVIASLRSAAPDKLRPRSTTLLTGAGATAAAAGANADDDDAAANPFYDPCPDVRLPAGVRRVFLDPVEVRTVWLRVPGTAGNETFPVRFRGATHGSLAFLDELEEAGEAAEGAAVDEPAADGQPLEVAAVPAPEDSAAADDDDDEADGFDLDELDDAPAF